MTFCNKYEEFMREVGQNKLPGIGCNRLKNLLESCTKQLHSHKAVHDHQNNEDAVPHEHEADSQHCQVCDGTFFTPLLQEMSAVVGFFNEKAQKLLERHLASGCSKCFIWLEDKLQGNHVALIQECKDLVAYASINAIAMRRLLKKYDKFHFSKQGQAFKTQAQSMQIEILQSPWLYELMAFHINMRESNKVLSGNAPALLEGCSLIFNDGKPSLSFQLFDSFKNDLDLTCSICLETLFDPVSLSCGHIFCYMCACKSGSVSIVDGLKSVHPKKSCPICREPGVYKSAVHLDELHLLLKRSCPEYWEERRKSEKKERVKLAKEHWESQTRMFMGV